MYKAVEIKFSNQQELDKIRLRDKYQMTNRGSSDSAVEQQKWVRKI